MVGVFRRSVSFPNKTNFNLNRPSQKPPISHHIRSISLPCRSHPLISQIKDEVNHLKTWSTKPQNRTSTWLIDGLTRLRDLHDSLVEILSLPQTLDSLRNQNSWIEKLLEDFLTFVDLYGTFRSSIMSLKEDQINAQVAMRKRDESKVVLYLKSRRRMEKQMVKIRSTVRFIAGEFEIPAAMLTTVVSSEIASVVSDVVEATTVVTAALFGGFGSRKCFSWIGFGFGGKVKKERIEEAIVEFREVDAEMVLLSGVKKRSDEEVRGVLKKMREVEGCICDIENVCEKVFRGLINTRVSLLNILTQ